jgi:hypothetical protein
MRRSFWRGTVVAGWRWLRAFTRNWLGLLGLVSFFVAVPLGLWAWHKTPGWVVFATAGAVLLVSLGEGAFETWKVETQVVASLGEELAKSQAADPEASYRLLIGTNLFLADKIMGQFELEEAIGWMQVTRRAPEQARFWERDCYKELQKANLLDAARFRSEHGLPEDLRMPDMATIPTHEGVRIMLRQRLFQLHKIAERINT